jgi:hypothetical protein
MRFRLPLPVWKGDWTVEFLGGPHCGPDATWSQRDEEAPAISKGLALMTAGMRTTASDLVNFYDVRTPWVVYLAINDLLSSAVNFSNRGRLKTHKTRGSSRSSCPGPGGGGGRVDELLFSEVPGTKSSHRVLSTWLGLDIWIPQTISCRSTVPLGSIRSDEDDNNRTGLCPNTSPWVFQKAGILDPRRHPSRKQG